MNTREVEQAVYPFTPRDVVYAEVVAPALSVSIEQAEALEVSPELVAFARELYEVPAEFITLYEGSGKRVRDLDDVRKISNDFDKKFYTGYFATDAGRAALVRLGVSPEVATDGDVQSALAEIVARDVVVQTLTHNDDQTVAEVARENNRQLSERQKQIDKERTAVAKESLDWYKEQIIAALLAAEEDTATDWHDSPTLHVNFAPDGVPEFLSDPDNSVPTGLLNKLEALQAYRAAYRQIGHRLKDEALADSGLYAKKRQLLSLYQAKVNNMMAAMYPDVVELASQLRVSPDTPRVEEWRERLAEAAPVVKYLFDAEEQENAELRHQFMRRLDLVRNGADVGSPKFTPLARQDIELAAELEAEGRQLLDAAVEQLPGEIVAKLDGATWNKDDLRQILAGVLSKWDLLSSVPAPDEETLKKRSGYASDGKWQIVFVRGKDSLSVNGAKRVMKVPMSFSRSGSESLAVASHELTHVVQNMFDEILAQYIPLAQVGGRRRVTGREMGGIYEERRMRARLGEVDGASTTYLRALQVKLNGGNQLETARAFYNAGKRSPGADQKKAKLAADRILRLYREGGHSSQPLDYLEQELWLRSFSASDPDTVRALVMSVTSFSFKDAAILQGMGMLKIPRQIRWHPAEDVTEVYLNSSLAA